MGWLTVTECSLSTVSTQMQCPSPSFSSSASGRVIPQHEKAPCPTDVMNNPSSSTSLSDYKHILPPASHLRSLRTVESLSMGHDIHSGIQI